VNRGKHAFRTPGIKWLSFESYIARVLFRPFHSLSRITFTNYMSLKPNRRRYH